MDQGFTAPTKGKNGKVKRAKRSGPGRPKFEPTAELKEQVAVAAGGGMSHEEIAIALKISRPTLYKHFAAELSEGAQRKRFEVLSALYGAAMKGNVAACKEFLREQPQLAAPPVRDADDDAPQAVEKAVLGKKEQANEDAKVAPIGTEWADDLRPRGKPN